MYFQTLKTFFFSILLLPLIGWIEDGRWQAAGVIVDKESVEPLFNVHLRFQSIRDTQFVEWSVTDSIGSFFVELPSSSAPYKLTASCIGYRDLNVYVFFKDGFSDLGLLKMSSLPMSLKEVSVVANEVAIVQKGDTTEFHAAFFKTREGASAYELVRKLPGLTLEGGKLLSNGEEISQILVDGKVFFSSDPNTALHTLPAHMVEKVQVFNKLSDESALSGFDDGFGLNTINLITYENKRNGSLVKAHVAGGSNGRYGVGGDYHLFQGDKRLSFNTLLNNTGAENTSLASGSMASASNNISRSMLKRVSSGQGDVDRGAFSMNANRNLSKSINLGVSYVFDLSDSDLSQGRNGVYHADSLDGLSYRQKSESSFSRYVHRLNGKSEIRFNSMQSLICNFNCSLHDSHGRYYNNSLNYYMPVDSLNWYLYENQSRMNGFGGSLSLVFMHRFDKIGRSISVAANSGVTEFNNRNDLDSERYMRLSMPSFIDVDTARSETVGSTRASNFGLRASYVEKLGNHWRGQLSVGSRYSKSNGDNLQSSPVQGVWLVNHQASSMFDQGLWENGGSLSFGGLLSKWIEVSCGCDLQFVDLKGEQLLPFSDKVGRSFISFLPNARLQLRKNQKFNTSIHYVTGVQYPNPGALQAYVDRSNPLVFTVGNPRLSHSYLQNYTIKGNYSRSKRKQYFHFNGSLRTLHNTVGNLITLNTSGDDMLVDGIVLSKGVQLNRPENIGDAYLFRFTGGYNWYVPIVKCNLSISSLFRSSQTPYSLNGRISSMLVKGMGSGLSLNSNWGGHVDCSMSYSAMYNIGSSVKNKNSFWSHRWLYSAFVSSSNGWKLALDGGAYLSLTNYGFGSNRFF
jgi:hypothetical protein